MFDFIEAQQRIITKIVRQILIVQFASLFDFQKSSNESDSLELNGADNNIIK